MNVNDAKIGLRVSHPRLGLGEIVSIDSDILDIEFDNGNNDKIIKSIKASSVSAVIQSQYINNNTSNQQQIKVGDNVFSEKYGEGVVVSRSSSFWYVVKFEKETEILKVLNTEIKKIEKTLVTEIEEESEEENTNFKIIPSNYSNQSGYSELDKRLLTSIKRRFLNEGYATIKPYANDCDQYGVLIVKDKGIIIFRIFENDEIKIDEFKNPLFIEYLKNEYHHFKKYYYDRFLNSKALCFMDNNGYKTAKYPIRFVFLYQNIDLSKMNLFEKNMYNNIPNFLYFRNFSSIDINNELFSNFEPYNKSLFKFIDNNDVGKIIERVVPENVTLIDLKIDEKIPNSNKIVVNPSFVPITGKEREFNALCLDDQQIRIINATMPGPHLTLANPGTGKSVLLLSKAYRIQSKKKGNHVLITCYNNNLAQHHESFSKTSGLSSENLHIRTFHSLLIELLEKYDPIFLRNNRFKTNDESKDEYDEFFDKVVDRVDSLIETQKVKTNFNAIFIDEVQLFESRWIDICFKLLDREDNKDYFFEMYGDINQDVRSKRKHGKASWQNTKCVPSLTGKTRTLDINYRNTDLISNYLKAIILDFNQYLNQHGMSIDDEMSCLPSHSTRKGTLIPSIIHASYSDFSKVGKLVSQLINQKKADYNDIAIVYPAKGYGKYYKPQWLIQKEFNERGIPYSYIHGENKTRLFECDGVIMSTIDSCLGLDFKYVILCGIHFWDFSDAIGTKITKKALLLNPEIIELYAEIGKKIYSACSRAREGLYIIDDLATDSPIKDILRPKGGRKYYVEN